MTFMIEKRHHHHHHIDQTPLVSAKKTDIHNKEIFLVRKLICFRTFCL